MKTHTLLIQFECDDSTKVYNLLYNILDRIPSVKTRTFVDIFNPDMLHYFQLNMHADAESDNIMLKDVLNKVPEPTWAEKCFINWTNNTRQL